jgi:hypothetical protein
MKLDNEEQRRNLMAIIDAFPIQANFANAMQVVQGLFQMKQIIEQAGLEVVNPSGTAPGD